MNKDGQLPLFYKRFLIVLTFIIVCMLAFVAVKMVQPTKASASEVGYNLVDFGSAVNGDYCPSGETQNGFPVYYSDTAGTWLYQGYANRFLIDSVHQDPVVNNVLYYTTAEETFDTITLPFTAWTLQNGDSPVGTMTEIACDSALATSTATTTSPITDMTVINLVVLILLFIIIVAGVIKLFILFKVK